MKYFLLLILSIVTISLYAELGQKNTNIPEEMRAYIDNYKPSFCDCDELDFSSSDLPINMIAKAVKKNRQIRSLVLPGLHLDQSDLETILQGFSRKNKLDSLDLSNNDLRTFCCITTAAKILGKFRLKNLNLANNKIYLEDLKSILSLLLKQGSIQRLDLSSNDLQADAALAIADFLEKYHDLKYLNIDSNNFGPQGMAAILKALKHQRAPLALTMTGLFDVSLVKLFPETNITELYFNDSGITDEDILALAPILPETNIKKLILYLNDISDKGVKKLLEVLPNTKIVELDLLNNHEIKDFPAIKNFMKNHPQIKILYGDI